MSTPAYKLRNSHRPDLPSGTYTLSVGQKGQLSDDRVERTIADTTFFFDLSQPMAELAPSDIVTLYPTNGANAPFDHVIPHIVLKNSMLPWMESMPTTGVKPMPPCLALILLRPGEAFSFADDQSAPDHERIRQLVIDNDLAATLIPSLGDLAKLAHVRVIDDIEHAVLLSNRLPASGGINTMCLVRVTDAYDASARTEVSLPCLKTWRFRCTAGKNHFHAVFDAESFSVGRLRVPLPDPSDAGWYAVAKDRLSAGFVPMAHHTSQGEDAISWYRGPCLPGPLLPDHCVQEHEVHHLEQKDLRQAIGSPSTFVESRAELVHRRHPTLEDETGDLSLTYYRASATSGPADHQGTERFRLRITGQAILDYLEKYPNIKPPLKGTEIERQLGGALPDVLHAWLTPVKAEAFIAAFFNKGRGRAADPPQFFLSPEMHLRPDALTREDPVTQLRDVSYAAAWQIGRMTGLADGNYRRAVMAWRRGCTMADARADTAGDHAHLCCFVPEHADHFPQEVDTFLVRLSHLKSIPLSYLVPAESMLPASSLRTFLVDPLWTYRLLQGALSIGSDACPCEMAESRALKRLATLARVDQGSKALSGLLMRSEAVSTWPGLKVNFYSEGDAALRKVDPEPRKPVPDVLLTVATQPFTRAEIALPEAHPHFEFARRHAENSSGDPTDPKLIVTELEEIVEQLEVSFSRRAGNFPADGQPFSSIYNPDTSGPGEGWPGLTMDSPPPRSEPPAENEPDDPSAPEPFSMPEDGLWLKQISLETGVEIAQHFRIGSHTVRIDFGAD